MLFKLYSVFYFLLTFSDDNFDIILHNIKWNPYLYYKHHKYYNYIRLLKLHLSIYNKKVGFNALRIVKLFNVLICLHIIAPSETIKNVH